MPRISTQSFFQRSINVLTDQQEKLSDIQLKISTGKKDPDPIAASRLLNLKQQLAEIENYQNSITNANFDLQSEEVQLKNIQDQLLEARELIILAGNGALVPANLNNIATQLEGVLDQLVSIANTNIDGKYMFAGSKTLSKPVIKNNAGVYEYQGDEVNRYASIGPSIAVAVNDTGKTIFFQIATEEVNVTKVAGKASVTSAATNLTNAGNFAALEAQQLQLNGIDIMAASSDGISTSDASASAIASAAAINSLTGLHGVVAHVNSTVFDFSGGTYSTGTLAPGDLTINGVAISGDLSLQSGAANIDKLVNLVNSKLDGSIVASNQAGELRLTAADGRNIQLQTAGSTASGITFANFDMTGGSLDKVYRGTIELVDSKEIAVHTNTFTGTANSIGLLPGEYGVANNSGNIAMTTPYFIQAPADGVSKNESYTIKFINSSQYQVFRESDPFTPISNFSSYAKNQSLQDAKLVEQTTVDYSDGDTLIIDGLSFSLAGTPVAGDCFNIDLTPVANSNLFASLQQTIANIRSNAGNSGRLSYSLGVALSNLDNIENRISEVRSSVGSRLTLNENQEKSNSAFGIFAHKAISEIEDLDMIDAISKLIREQWAFEAAQRSIAKIQMSLFDFI